jgi:hypothetical protein
MKRVGAAQSGSVDEKKCFDKQKKTLEIKPGLILHDSVFPVKHGQTLAKFVI